MAERYLRRQRGGKVSSAYEFDILRKDGSIRHVQLRSVTIKEANGSVRTVAQILDISEQQKLKEQLLYERDLLHALMDNIPDTIYFKDKDARFMAINKAHALQMGIESPEEAKGKTDFDFFTEEFALQTFKDEQKIIATGEPLIGKIEKITPLGKAPQWVSATKVPIRNPKGEITGLVGISRDITDRMLLEEALKESEVKFRSTIESAPNAIILSDEKSHILSWNTAAKNMFQYKKKEILNRSFLLLIPERYKKRFKKSFQEIKKTGNGNFIEKTIKMEGLRKDGVEIPIEFSIATWKADDKTFFSTIIRDISEQIGRASCRERV